MHVLHSNKALDTLLTGTGMTSASACPIVYIYISERICLFTLETMAGRLWCGFGSQNTIFFHCHKSVTLIHVVFETLIAIHIFQRFFGINRSGLMVTQHLTSSCMCTDCCLCPISWSLEKEWMLGANQSIFC
jgi:hypothetical protein